MPAVAPGKATVKLVGLGARQSSETLDITVATCHGSLIQPLAAARAASQVAFHIVPGSRQYNQRPFTFYRLDALFSFLYFFHRVIFRFLTTMTVC